jgi:glycerol transport system ATP-binding protein
MYDGRVVQIGTPEELFERPEHTFVGYFIGSPGMNLIPATVDGTTARIEGAEIPLGRGYKGLSGKVEIGVRPEFARLSQSEGLPVTVRRIEDVGRHKIIRAEFFGRDINIIAREEDAVSADMNRVIFDADHINVYADDWRVAGEAA